VGARDIKTEPSKQLLEAYLAAVRGSELGCARFTRRSILFGPGAEKGGGMQRGVF
jgi:hypothetical protein